MKKILLLILILLAMVVSACGKSSKDDSSTKEQAQVVYTYNDFTASEKTLYKNLYNEVIPFVANNEYYVSVEGNNIVFYTVGNTSAEFDAYKAKLESIGYTNTAWSQLDGYTYEKGSIKLIVSYVRKSGVDYLTVVAVGNAGDNPGTEPTPVTPPTTESKIASILKEAASLADGATLDGDRSVTGTVKEIKEAYTDQYKNISFVLTDGTADIIVWRAKGDCASTLSVGSTVTVTGQIINYQGTIEFQYPELSGASGNGGNQNPATPPVSGGYEYTSFTSAEVSLMNQYLGDVLPFLATDEYSLEGLYEEEDYENGFCLITYGNTNAEFKSYLNTFATYGFQLEYEEADEEGDMWYVYTKNDIAVEAVWFEYEGEYCVNVYAYLFEEDNGGNDDPVTPPATTNTIASILNEAANLAVGSTLSGDRSVEGTIKEIKESYTDQYKNISFVLTDGTADILVWRSKGDCASTLAVGSKVTVTGQVINYNGTIEFQYAALTSDGSTGPVNPNPGTTNYLYTSFTSSEVALFNQYLGGEVVPFFPNNDYSLEGYYEETDYENGFYLMITGATKAEFESYFSLLVSNGYEYYGEEADEEGDVWYTYTKNDDIVLDAVWYEYQGEYYVDIAIYSLTYSSDGNGGGSGSEEDVDLITNEGRGLPTGVNGVYDVRFTDATYVKNVTEQGYYLDGCPTTGNVKVLVIPVEFSDRTASSLGYDISKINTAFNGVAGSCDYHSVAEYYNISSYGLLDLEFVVLDSWFKPANNSSYYLNQTIDYYGYETEVGDQMIINEALAYLESRMDLSEFDSDNNGYIDAVIVVNTLDIDADVTMKWAYRYWNILEESEGELYEYDGVSANDYLWASYKFMLEEYDESGNVSYDDRNLETYTYIHEFGHVLGADDYYDTAYENEPLLGCDIMDSMLGDHNAFTKFNLGWLTTSRLVVAEETVTLTLEDFSKNGDTIIIANNWDAALGVYQEYYVLMYYKNSGLNGGDAGYFATDGVVVYHVNASLCSEVIDGETYYDIYYNNTAASSDYGTSENLIELVQNAQGNYVHTQGVSSNKNTLDDNGNKIAYYFTVDSLTADSATITFTKNN